jgi:hypothetical protein
MTSFGNTLTTERRRPRDLVRRPVDRPVGPGLREEYGEPEDTSITLRHREER